MSVQSNYTATDIRNATAYAQANVDKLLLNAAHKSHPHIVSHVTLDDGKLVASPEFLAQFNCTMFRSTSLNLCDQTDPPRWLRTGDESFKLGCNWACFNLKPVQFDKDKKAIAQSTEWQLRPNGQVELFISTNYWFEFSQLRDEARFKNRVNNFPAGFDSVIGPNGSQSYRLNDTYCEAFVAKFEPRTGTCKSLADPILSWVLGDSLVKHGRLLFENSLTRLSLSTKAKPAPSQVPTLEQWKTNIDRTWVMQQPQLLDSQILSVPGTGTVASYSTVGNVVGKIAQGTLLVLKAFVESLFTPEFWAQFGAQLVLDKLTSLLMAQLNQKVVQWLGLVNVGQRVVLQALSQSIFVYGLRYFQLELTRYVLRSLLWSANAALSGLSIFLFIGSLINIVLTIVDPFNLNEELNAEYLERVQLQAIQEFYKDQSARIVLTVPLLADLLNVPGRQDIDLQQTILYTYQYLSRLKFNSDGFRIVNDFTILARSDNTKGTQVVSLLDTEKDTAKFKDRAQCFKFFRLGTLVVATLFIFALVGRIYFLAIVFLVLLVSLLAVSYLNLAFDVPNQITGTFETLQQLLGLVGDENASESMKFVQRIQP